MAPSSRVEVLDGPVPEADTHHVVGLLPEMVLVVNIGGASVIPGEVGRVDTFELPRSPGTRKLDGLNPPVLPQVTPWHWQVSDGCPGSSVQLRWAAFAVVKPSRHARRELKIDPFHLVVAQARKVLVRTEGRVQPPRGQQVKVRAVAPAACDDCVGLIFDGDGPIRESLPKFVQRGEKLVPGRDLRC